MPRYITVDGEPRGIAIDSDNKSTKISLSNNEITKITIEVENGEQTTQTISYTLYISYYAFNVTISENGTMDTDNILDEGSTITLGTVIIGNSENYSYEWIQAEGKPLRLSSTTTAFPSFTIPADYIASTTSMSADIVIRLRLVDNRSNLLSVLNKRITIRKVDNHKPTLDSGLTVNSFTLSFDEQSITDLDGIGTFSYQWQSRDINAGWVNIPSATTTSYTVSQTDSSDRLYRVLVTYADAQGYGNTGYVLELRVRVDIDIDDDGLIEIYYLEQLDAVRHDLDGTSYATMGRIIAIG